MGMEDKRHPGIKDLPFEVPQNIHPDAFLFLGDPNRETRTLVGRWWLCTSAALILGGSVLLGNALNKRPISASFHKTILMTILGGIGGEALNTHKENYMAEKDLQMFHYICLHPEDFPKPKRVLYRDYLSVWHPFR